MKIPKVYLADSGLLHALLQLPTPVDAESHPKLGASWEGFGIAQVVKILGAKADECCFWRTHGREAFRLSKKIEAIPLSAATQSLTPLR